MRSGIDFSGSMFQALAALLAARGELSQSFRVIPWEGEGRGDALDSFRIAGFPGDDIDRAYTKEGTLYQVLDGGGSVVMGYILHICDPMSGSSEVAYWVSFT